MTKEQLIEKREKIEKINIRDDGITITTNAYLSSFIEDLKSLQEASKEEMDNEWIRKLREEKNIAMGYEEFRDRILSNLPKQSDKEVEIKKENYVIVGCPNCDWGLDTRENDNYSYCPNCGAKIKRIN